MFRKIPRRMHRQGLLHTIPSSWNSMFSYLEYLKLPKTKLCFNLHWTDRSRNQWSDGDGQQIGWDRNGLLINRFSVFATHTNTTQKGCHFGWMSYFGAECKFHRSGVLAWHYRSCVNRLTLTEYVRMLLALRLLRFQPRQSTCLRRCFVHNRHNQFATRLRGQIDGQFSTNLFHMLGHDEIHWNFSAFGFDGNFLNRQFTNVQQLCDSNENGFQMKSKSISITCWIHKQNSPCTALQWISRQLRSFCTYNLFDFLRNDIKVQQHFAAYDFTGKVNIPE